jgi:prephenate dehydrogenase
VGGADLVILAAPPVDCLRLIGELGGAWRARLGAGTTVTDVASTKRELTEVASRAGIPFVGGHPMAGREVTGFTSATADLLRDRPWVITEAVGGGDPAVVETLARDAGARPIRTTAAEHDDAVAAISHLPLIASVALVEAILGADGDAPPADEPLIRALAASGWRDMTRLSRGDPAMGAGIAATNAVALRARIRRYIERLEAWSDALDGSPPLDGLEQRMDAARRRLGEPPL